MSAPSIARLGWVPEVIVVTGYYFKNIFTDELFCMKSEPVLVRVIRFNKREIVKCRHLFAFIPDRLLGHRKVYEVW